MSVSSRDNLEEKCFKVAECICHHKESYFKVAECICHLVFIWSKLVLKLQNAYIMTCSSEENWFQSCGMYIALRVHQEECYFKVAQCICHHVFIRWKVVLKLRNVYIIKCSL